MFCFSTFQSPANNSINYSCVISWASRDNQRSTCNFIWDIKGSYLFSTRKTFAQVNSRLMEFLMEWLLALGLKEFLVECATAFVKSEVILYRMSNIIQYANESFVFVLVAIKTTSWYKFIISLTNLNLPDKDLLHQWKILRKSCWKWSNLRHN